MTPNSQARVFRWLRWRQARNSLRTLQQTNPVRLLTLLAATTFVAALVFGMSLIGFRELEQNRVPFKGLIVAALFDILFVTLGGMLLLSTGIILYASLFTSPETRFLLTTPATADRIFATKFQTAVSFSSYGFVILGLPVLIAYGLMAGVPWSFFVLLPAFLLGFVLLPAALSSIACLLLMRFLPRNRRQALVLLAGCILAVFGYWLYGFGVSANTAISGAGGRDALHGLASQFALASHPLMPSHWMTNGLLAAARGDFQSSLRPLALLWSNGLVVYLLAAWLSSRLYRTAYDRSAGGGTRRKRHRGLILDRIMEGLVWYLDKPTRVLVVKDFRCFRRDPSQWALLVVFGTLLIIGAGNFRSYYTTDLDVIDQYIIGLVNLGGTAVLLCAGLSRFIFPLISLEGRKFWILGLMPIGRRQILTGKFAFAATCSLLAGLAMVIGSELLLNLSLEGLVIHAITIASIALGLSGLNAGLGAYLPNFRETDPSKIVVGLSGTVNMVLGLAFLAVTLAFMAGPLHVAAVMMHFEKNLGSGFPVWVYAGIPVGLLLSVLAVWLPMRMGHKALVDSEF